MKNKLYPKSYGSWAGNPADTKPDYNRCCKEVRESNGWHYYQCTRKRGYGPDEAYCKTHDPAAVAAREKASLEKYNEERRKERFRFYGKTFFDALKEIADGHNDARGLAQEIITNFEKKKY